MRKRALSWAVGLILAVFVGLAVFGCSEIVNTLLPGGVADPAGIVPVASGSATLQDNAGRFYQFANTGGAITMTGDCAGVQVFQSALSGASDPETLAFTGCSGTVQQPYIRLQQPSPLQVDHAWVTGSTGCDRYNPNSSLVWELDLAACGVGSGTPPPPQVSDSDGDGVPDGQDQCPTVRGNPPSGCPPQNPPPGDGGTYYGGATLQMSETVKWVVFMRQVGLLQLLSTITCPATGFGSASVGAEEFGIGVSSCSFADSYNVYRFANAWFTNATGCFDILNDGAQLGTSRCPKGGTVPPPSGGSCGLAQYDTNRNGIYEDNEILEAVRQWVLGGLTDDCILKAIKLWVRGEQIGTQGDDSSLTQSELAKIRQTLGDPVADLLIRMEQ